MPPFDARASSELSSDFTAEYSSANLPRAPPSSPTSNFKAQVRRERRSRTLNIPCAVDLRAVTYVVAIDENLICPICRCALIDPVTTGCDHTFCRDCILGSLSHNEMCPIDRSPMDRGTPLLKSPKIIQNQLDNLKAKCPCCEDHIPRSMLKYHLEKYCMEAPMFCPGKHSESDCQEQIKRKHHDKGCLHYLTTCPDCENIIFQVEMEDHRERACEERKSSCELCGAEILRCKQSEHSNTCPDLLVSCQWKEYGCQYEAKRRELKIHDAECSFKLVGPMAESLKKELRALRADMRSLAETNQLQERRIKFLEKGSHNPERMLDYSDLPSQAFQTTLPESTNTDALDSAHEYLLSLLEAQESKVSQLSADMTELDSKQTVLLFNETIPIKNELAEMRSNLQVTSMHVRWLMRFRIQENQRRGGGLGPGPGAAGSAEMGGSGNDGILPRRLSDSVREIITKL